MLISASDLLPSCNPATHEYVIKRSPTANMTERARTAESAERNAVPKNTNATGTQTAYIKIASIFTKSHSMEFGPERPLPRAPKGHPKILLSLRKIVREKPSTNKS